MPKATRRIRLVIPVTLSDDAFYESLLQTKSFPQVAWHAGKKGFWGVAAGESELSPSEKAAPLLHLLGGKQAIPKCLPWAWRFEPFDGTSRPRGSPPWGLLNKGVFFVPQTLLWRDETSTWLIYTGAAHASETARTAASRLVSGAASILQRVLTTKRATPQPLQPSFKNRRVAHDNFRKRVADLKKDFGKKKLAKVVLAREIVQAAPTNKRWDAVFTFKRLLSQNPSATVFFCRCGVKETFLGATPETLCEVKKGRVTTHAVAGTASRGRTSDEDAKFGRKLLDSTKDRHEHALVVAHLRAKLGTRTRPATLRVAALPTLLKLPHVQHLATAIDGRLLPKVTALEVAQALHPTPAVCGTPMRPARAYLRQNETFSRGLYAGFAGWQSAQGDGVFVVTIRSLLLTLRHAFIFAGAGIVPGSSPELEDAETELKAQGAARALVAAPDLQGEGPCE